MALLARMRLPSILSPPIMATSERIVDCSIAKYKPAPGFAESEATGVFVKAESEAIKLFVKAESEAVGLLRIAAFELCGTLYILVIYVAPLSAAAAEGVAESLLNC